MALNTTLKSMMTGESNTRQQEGRMKFYVFRACNTDKNEPPVKYVPLTKECTEGFSVPDWVMDADSFEDAFDKLMPESPFKEFLVYKMPDDEWAIEIID